MKLDFEKIPDLPRLAWGARLRKGQDAVKILHGPWVETRDDHFFEGAWDGPLEALPFDQALTFLGSGARLTDDGILFAAPTHTFDLLYSVRTGNERFVSNSLAFVLALSGERLDPRHRHYYLDFLDFNRAGIRIKDKRLRLAGSRFLELYDCCNLAIRPDLAASRIEKPLGAPPRDYDDYVAFLSRTVEQVFANAAYEGRKWRYRPVTCLSQGYDTTAVATLASKAGCREAVTFRKSNGAAGYQDDSGSEIGPYLNLRITEYERTDSERLAQHRLDEFYIEPHGTDRSMVLMEEQLTGALLLTGRFGGGLWNLESFTRWGLPGDTGRPLFQLPNRLKIGGCSLFEFRLRTGFVHFPLACSGGLHSPAIKRITESQAMKPWSIGGEYDRPIPRRIAEEAGVRRHLFGQVKKGGPNRTGGKRRNWIRRKMYSLWSAAYWPPLRLLTLRVIGNRSNPAWRQGSFEVQSRVEKMIERYLTAVSAHVPLS